MLAATYQNVAEVRARIPFAVNGERPLTLNEEFEALISKVKE